MDFFERQERARKKTGVLVLYFALAVAGIIAVIQGVAAVLFDLNFLDPELLMYVAGGVLLVVAGGSFAKIAELSQGGRVVAAMLGGQPVSPHTTDTGERRLMNIVEEMSIASGVPVPEVYLLDERGINAFAAGHGPGDTAIGVTRGALDSLTRDELQGVIAHEYSHILHGDMRLNIRLIGLLNGILGLAFVGGFLLRLSIFAPSDGSSRGDRRNAGGITFVFLALGLTLYAAGWIGVFFGNLIKAAVSRQREFLADASAVQYTRNPDGIAGALAKIGKFTSRLQSPRAAEASHMFFGNGLGDPFFGAFATHPPIAERIAAINPSFDPSQVKIIIPPPIPKSSPKGAPAKSIFGTPEMPSTAFGAALLAALPAFCRDAAHEIHSACALVYALLLDSDEARRAAQLEGLDIEPGLQREMMAFFERRGEIQGPARIALVDLSIPTLRQLSDAQYQRFRANIKHLVESDRQIDLFEFVLHKILLRHLDLAFTKSTGARVQYRSIVPVFDEVVTLLSALALVGQTDPADREAAFAAGLRELLFKPASKRAEMTDSADLTSIGAALDKLAEASPEVKKRVLHACAQCVACDGIVAPAEYELLRAIGDALDCPVPPLPVPA